MLPHTSSEIFCTAVLSLTVNSSDTGTATDEWLAAPGYPAPAESSSTDMDIDCVSTELCEGHVTTFYGYVPLFLSADANVSNVLKTDQAICFYKSLGPRATRWEWEEFQDGQQAK